MGAVYCFKRVGFDEFGPQLGSEKPNNIFSYFVLIYPSNPVVTHYRRAQKAALGIVTPLMMK